MAVPHYILTAAEDPEEEPKEGMNHEEEKEVKAKKANDEEDKEKPVEAIVAALIAASGHDGRTIPVVRAKLAEMEDEEEDEAKKAAIQIARKVFYKGSGSKKATEEKKDDESVDAKVAMLEAKIKEPRMAKILQASVSAGVNQDYLNSLTAKMKSMSLSEFESYEKEMSPFISQAVTASTVEASIPFQGVLTASAGESLDAILGTEAKA